jgi:hypothetical protein
VWRRPWLAAKLVGARDLNGRGWDEQPIAEETPGLDDDGLDPF